MARDGKQDNIIEKDRKQAKNKPKEKIKGMKKNMTPEKDLKKIKSGSIVKLFDKTPAPKKQNDVYCPHFWELKYANGCKFDCQWCYLLGTFGRWRKEGDPRTPRLKNEKQIEKDLEEAMERINTPQLFNAGEVSDAMLYPHMLLNKIIPIFKKYEDKGHKLLLLTKDVKTARRVISHADATRSIIFAWSVNAHYVSRTYELLAPDTIDRLSTAAIALNAGYEVRLRIDPMVPVTNWKIGYRKLIQDIMRICPWATVITLGSLRGLQSTINEAKRNRKDMSWLSYLGEESNWGKKIDEDTRYDMYKFIIEELNKAGYKGHISLCKETLAIWKRLKTNRVIDYGPGDKKCNCTLTEPKGKTGSELSKKIDESPD